MQDVVIFVLKQYSPGRLKFSIIIITIILLLLLWKLKIKNWEFRSDYHIFSWPKHQFSQPQISSCLCLCKSDIYPWVYHNSAHYRLYTDKSIKFPWRQCNTYCLLHLLSVTIKLLILFTPRPHFRHSKAFIRKYSSKKYWLHTISQEEAFWKSRLLLLAWILEKAHAVSERI